MKPSGLHQVETTRTPTVSGSPHNLDDNLPSFTQAEIAQALLDALTFLMNRRVPRFLRATEQISVDRTQVTRTITVEMHIAAIVDEIENSSDSIEHDHAITQVRSNDSQTNTATGTQNSAAHAVPNVHLRALGQSNNTTPVLIPLAAARRGHHWSYFQITASRGHSRAVTRRISDKLTSDLIKLQWQRAFEDNPAAMAMLDVAASIPLLPPEKAESASAALEHKFKSDEDLAKAPNPMPTLALVRYLARRYLVWVSVELPRGRTSAVTYSYTREMAGVERPHLVVDKNADLLTRARAKMRRFFNQPATAFDIEVGLPFEAESYHLNYSPDPEFFVSEQFLGLELPKAVEGAVDGVPQLGDYPSKAAKQRSDALSESVAELNENGAGSSAEYYTRGTIASTSVNLYLTGYQPERPRRLTAWILLKEAPPGTTGTALMLAALVLVFVGTVTFLYPHLLAKTLGGQIDTLSAIIAISAVIFSFAAAIVPRGKQSQWRMPLLSRAAFLFATGACVVELVVPLVLPWVQIPHVTPTALYNFGMTVQWILFSGLAVLTLQLAARRLKLGREYWNEAFHGRSS